MYLKNGQRIIFLDICRRIKQTVKLPGTLVPNATKVTAVTESFKPTVQPKCEAKSPITAVRHPMKIIETTKHKYPEYMSVTKSKYR